MVELRGESEEEVRAVAGKAATALEEVLREFPAYPHRGALQLEHAHALERAGHSERSSRELRQIALTRAGEPEADAAWSALSVHAEQRKPVNAGPFSAREDLERAVHARRLHHAELSRALLDRVLDDARTTKDVRDEALRARADTAYAQQDYAQCAADLRETKSPALRRSLLRCLERGGLYREAIALSMGSSGNAAPTGNATAVWETMELALRGGLYAVAEKLLADYEKLAKGHAAQRAWLHAWLPYRLGQWEEAVTAFERAERHPSQRIRARYFRGALLLARGGDDGRAQGASLLRGIADATPYEYYGLQARQRLLDAGADVAQCPTLEPLPDEATPPSREAIVERFEALDAKFGDTWAPLRRARQLHAAGYVDEARRELRIAVEAFLSRGKASRGPRSESLFQGLGWKARWPSPPRLDVPDAAFAALRDEGARDALRSGLRLLARGLDEPFDFARLTTTPAGSPHARWHLRAYRDVIEREARLRSIDPVDLWSLMHTESHFHRHVVSPVGARGALQIMPSTARRLAERLGELDGGRFDDDSLFDIDQNGHLAAYYVAELSKKFHGQAPMAYASYNGGPHNVARWLAAKATSEVPLTLDAFVEEIPFSETYRYTRRVMEVSARYAMLYRGELPRWTNAVDPRVEDNIDF